MMLHRIVRVAVRRAGAVRKNWTISVPSEYPPRLFATYPALDGTLVGGERKLASVLIFGEIEKWPDCEDGSSTPERKWRAPVL